MLGMTLALCVPTESFCLRSRAAFAETEILLLQRGHHFFLAEDVPGPTPGRDAAPSQQAVTIRRPLAAGIARAFSRSPTAIRSTSIVAFFSAHLHSPTSMSLPSRESATTSISTGPPALPHNGEAGPHACRPGNTPHPGPARGAEGWTCRNACDRIQPPTRLLRPQGRPAVASVQPLYSRISSCRLLCITYIMYVTHTYCHFLPRMAPVYGPMSSVLSCGRDTIHHSLFTIHFLAKLPLHPVRQETELLLEPPH